MCDLVHLVTMRFNIQWVKLYWPEELIIIKIPEFEYCWTQDLTQQFQFTESIDFTLIWFS